MRSVLLLHGWANHRPAGHWQVELATALRGLGDRVEHPQLPDADTPDLGRWLEALDAGLARTASDPAADERLVVAHSLGSALWLHAVARPTGVPRVDRVLLVSPPAPAVLAGHPEVSAFAHSGATAADLGRAAGSTRVVAADDDPYCPGGAVDVVLRPAGLLEAVEVDVVRGAGHLDLDAGYGAWPSALAWCLDPTTRLTAR